MKVLKLLLNHLLKIKYSRPRNSRLLLALNSKEQLTQRKQALLCNLSSQEILMKNRERLQRTIEDRFSSLLQELHSEGGRTDGEEGTR